jgi:hypothetical protein
MHTNFGWKVYRKDTTQEDLGIDGKIISEWILSEIDGNL